MSARHADDFPHCRRQPEEKPGCNVNYAVSRGVVHLRPTLDTVHPSFLGPDLPYALGWFTLALAGPGPYSLDERFFAPALRPRPTPAPSRPPVARPHWVRGLPVVGRAGGATSGRLNPMPLPLARDIVARRTNLCAARRSRI